MKREIVELAGAYTLVRRADDGALEMWYSKSEQDNPEFISEVTEDEWIEETSPQEDEVPVEPVATASVKEACPKGCSEVEKKEEKEEKKEEASVEKKADFEDEHGIPKEEGTKKEEFKEKKADVVGISVSGEVPEAEKVEEPVAQVLEETEKKMEEVVASVEKTAADVKLSEVPDDKKPGEGKLGIGTESKSKDTLPNKISELDKEYGGQGFSTGAFQEKFKYWKKSKSAALIMAAVAKTSNDNDLRATLTKLAQEKNPDWMTDVTVNEPAALAPIQWSGQNVEVGRMVKTPEGYQGKVLELTPAGGARVQTAYGPIDYNMQDLQVVAKLKEILAAAGETLSPEDEEYADGFDEGMQAFLLGDKRTVEDALRVGGSEEYTAGFKEGWEYGRTLGKAEKAVPGYDLPGEPGVAPEIPIAVPPKFEQLPGKAHEVSLEHPSREELEQTVTERAQEEEARKKHMKEHVGPGGAKSEHVYVGVKKDGSIVVKALEEGQELDDEEFISTLGPYETEEEAQDVASTVDQMLGDALTYARSSVKTAIEESGVSEPSADPVTREVLGFYQDMIRRGMTADAAKNRTISYFATLDPNKYPEDVIFDVISGFTGHMAGKKTGETQTEMVQQLTSMADEAEGDVWQEQLVEEEKING